MTQPSEREPTAPRAIGGRHHPPAAHLTGRAGACRILGIGKRELRRLEIQKLLVPALIQGGVRWFDKEAVWKLAVERHKAGKKPRRRRAARLEGVERVTGAETRQIYRWFDEDRTHADVVQLSGKTAETIRYLHRQWSTPNGQPLRASTPPASNTEQAIYSPERSGYFPEREEREKRPRPAPAGASAPRAAKRGTFEVAPESPEAPPPARVAPVPAKERTVTIIPDEWWQQEDD